MMINEFAKDVYQNAKEKGFHDNEKNIGEMLCLIHSEVSEALEADRKDFFTKLPDNLHIRGMAEKGFGNTYWDDEFFKVQFELLVKNTFEDELADIVIRVCDLAASRCINLEAHMKAKHRYNKMRPHKHGKKY